MTNNPIKARFSNNLRFHMSQKGVTQQELADAIGTAQQTVSAWCVGAKLPRMETVKALADYLGTTSERLFGGNDITNANDLAFRSLREAGYYDLTEEDREAVARLVKSLSDARRGR